MIADPEPPRTGRDPFARRVAVAALIVLLMVGLAALIRRGMNVLLLAFAGLLFAAFLSGLARWTASRAGLRYGAALAVVVLVLAALAGGCGWLLVDRLSAQTRELSAKLPLAIEQLRERLADYPWGRLLLDKAPAAAEATIAQAGDLARLTGVVSGASGAVAAVVVILFVGLFGAAEPDTYRNGLLRLVPLGRRPRAGEVLDAIAGGLRGWAVGQVVLMVVMAATTWLGLWAIGLPFAMTLAVIAGLFELVPYLGPWLSAVPAVLIALTLGPTEVGMTLGLYLALHLLEGYLLLPLIQRQAVHQPPALILVSQVLLGELAGVLGLFVAPPLTVAAVIAVRMLYVEDALGDRGGTGPSGGPTNSN